MSKVCVLLVDGFEEIEAVTVIDVLRRAEVETTMVAVSDRRVTGSHGICLEADTTLDDTGGTTWDMVILPGGMPGSARLRDDPRVQALVRGQHADGRRLAAICAAPIALAHAGVLAGRRATSYPAFASQLGEVRYSEDAVVVDGPITTSRGVGTALAFALSLVEQLVGPEKARDLAQKMVAAELSPR